MKKTILFYTALLCLFLSKSFAQTDIKLDGKAVVSGIVLDQLLQEPLPFVTVALKDAQSKEILGGQISDEKGKFTLEGLSVGSYLIDFQFIGYKLVSREVTISSKNQKVDLGTIKLGEQVTELQWVEVVAERSTVQQMVDRKVINIGKDLATTGPTAADLMVNIPSVNIDPDGAISLRGNENVRILVDGKPTNLSAAQLLQQTPSNSIKKIELITNPSAKYIPDGMSGIINIVLHKDSNLGLNGNFQTGFTFGQEYRFSGSASANYRTKKVNLFANYGNSHGVTPTWGWISRPNDPSQEIWTFISDRKSNLFKVGVDYFLGKNTVLSAYTIRNSFDSYSDRATTIEFPENASSNFGQRYLSNLNNSSSTYNFDITHKLQKEGAQLEFEIDYSEFTEEDLADFIFTGKIIEAENAQETVGVQRKNTTANLDYVTPLGSRQKLELGAEIRIQKTDNRYQTTNPNFNSSLYNFDRDIYSAYFNYSHKLDKWNYQIGARIEGFEMVGLLQEETLEDQRFSSPIFSVYPSGFLTYTPDPEKQKDAFNLSVSRRVDRPNLQQVTPIRVWSSPRITNIGNPALVPQFTNSIEFNYTRQLREGSITSGLFLRRIEDEITRFAFTPEGEPENIYFSYNNYRNNTAYGFELSGNYKVSSVWSFTSSFDLYSQTQRGLIRDELREVENVIYNFRTNHSFKINKKLTMQLINLYRGPYTNLQYKRLAFHFINIGARYEVLDGDGTVSLSFNDIFKTQQNSFDADLPVVQEGVFDWDSRTVFLGYSHRFGRGKSQSSKRKKRDQNETKSGGF